MKLCLEMLNYAYTDEGFLYWNYGEEGVSWEYDSDGVPAFTDLVNDDTDTDPMTKYNGATWGASCIQATNLLYLKNSQTACDADSTWFYVFPDDEEKNLAVTGGWKWPKGVTFLTEESDELDEIAGNIPTFVAESYASFLTGAKDIDDDAVWNQYLSDLESYNLSRVLEIRQACYSRYLAR
jgi:putative aldouronate transport system substrate-binding protein